MKILSALLAAIMALLNFTGLHHAPVLSEEWKTTVKENYAEFIGEVDGNKDRIPIIISTVFFLHPKALPSARQI